MMSKIRSDEGADKTESQRNYLRVGAVMSFRIRPASPEEARRAKENGIVSSNVTRSKLSVGAALSQSSDLSAESRRVFERFFELLISIDQKLNVLLDSFQKKVQDEMECRDRNVEISGGGIRFEVSEDEVRALGLVPTVGAALKLDLFLPSVPPNTVSCFAEVRRVERNGMKFSVGVAFTVITEDDRQEIIRFVTIRERAMLQARRDRSERDEK